MQQAHEASPATVTNRRLDLEWIRVIAIMGVVFIHVASPVVNNFGQTAVSSWFVISMLDALVRWCVPVFIMVSGALVLSKNEAPRRFYGKRLGRIGWPLAFWLVAYWLAAGAAAPPQKPPLELLEDLIWNQPYLHFYFLFIMLELSVLTPWLRRVVRLLTPKSLWVLTALFLYIGMAYQTKTTFVGHLFIPYIGYYLYGYLVNETGFSARHHKIIALLSVVAAAGTMVWLRYLVIQRELVLPGVVNSLDVLAYLSPLVVVSSLIMFPFCKDNAVLRRIIKVVPAGLIALLGSLSFGIYLIHPILQLAQGRLFPGIDSWQRMHTVPATLAIWAVIFAASTFLVAALKRVPLLKQIV